MILSGYTIEVYGCEKGTQLQIAAILTKMAKLHLNFYEFRSKQIYVITCHIQKRNRQDVCSTCKVQRFFAHTTGLLLYLAKEENPSQNKRVEMLSRNMRIP